VTVAELLLTRQGLLSLQPAEHALPPELLQAVDVQLAGLGYALTTQLRQRLAMLTFEDLNRVQEWLYRTLSEVRGAGQTHEPLFRTFPHGIPDDTFDLWLRKFLIYFVQAPEQACLFCGQTSTTHVLNPCLHVICDCCFDGASYSACPACEQHVDRTSPFFKPVGIRLPSAAERVRFTLIHLGEEETVEAQRLLHALCSRRQALSPADREALTTIVAAYGQAVLTWLPAEIPVKETIALIFGALLRSDDTALPILAAARPYLATATDVLRLLAALSGADPSLQGQVIYREDEREKQGRRVNVRVPRTIYRFEMARLRRPLRRDLLAILDGLDQERLVEDMLRHRSYWIWAGEFLHPFEYATRYPRAALAFAILRETTRRDDTLGRRLSAEAAAWSLEETGRARYRYSTYYARLESAVACEDSAALARLLAERPGELARHLDQALQVTLAAGQTPELLIAAYQARVQSVATPLLVTLRSLLARRASPLPVRLFWPKGQVAKGVCTADERSPLPMSVIVPLIQITERALLRRFADKPRHTTAVVDRALMDVMAPFNERTASRAAVSLPRGSRIALPDGHILRLFLHWCQPAAHGYATDLDLSVAFYDAEWGYAGVCSYYQLKFNGPHAQEVALSAGDLRDAPYPDGATEFVDVYLARARAEGIRYAVMVVNSYAGLPFAALERAYAGVMLRDDAEGLYLDPRTVTLKFDLQGAHGVFLPMVVDLEARVIHWLDVYSTGQFEFNNVETSKAAIRTICPAMIAYFGSGVRPSIYEVALLQAAARCDTVWVRGDGGTRGFHRRPAEDPSEYHQRIVAGVPDEARSVLPAFTGAVFACLYRGDVDLPPGSTCYALFREGQSAVLAASELLS
jgi:hypothetical protein